MEYLRIRGQPARFAGVIAIPRWCLPEFATLPGEALSRHWAGLLIQSPTGANPLKPVPTQVLAKAPEPIHRPRRQTIASAEVLNGLQPFLVVNAHSLEDRLNVGGD